MTIRSNKTDKNIEYLIDKNVTFSFSFWFLILCEPNKMLKHFLPFGKVIFVLQDISKTTLPYITHTVCFVIRLH